ncbi:streptococcal 67 kDa myosin-cross-reactive antigen like family-domain-containing protein [Aspergillus recurvatus]
MTSNHDPATREKPPPKNQREAWIIGSGTAALASALYLVRLAGIAPQKIHILDSHGSLGLALHHHGDHCSGYDQFAGCLPVPVGEPLKELLALVPSVRDENMSVFDEIENANAELGRAQSGTSTEKEKGKGKGRKKEKKKKQRKEEKNNRNDHTRFLVQRDGELRTIPTDSLNLNVHHRLSLMRFFFKREASLQRKRISDYLPPSFFGSTFWAIWSAQFGFQPGHSASEFRRTIRQYIRDFHGHGLAMLSCLDITGPYQFEAVFMPIYHFLRSLDVDYRFDARVKDVGTAVREGQTVVDRIDYVEDGFELRQLVGGEDIVIITLGSTVSGSTTGTNEDPPLRTSLQPSEALGENWALWLELEARHGGLGDPYNFCTRQRESMIESFTVTTEDLDIYARLCALSESPVLAGPGAGSFIALQESPWGTSVCLPTQPVFSEQPPNVRVFWGFAKFPESKGEFVPKAMVRCCGAEIMEELLGHLHLDPRHLVKRTVTVPRVMPRMSAILLPRALGDRPEVIPPCIANLGLVGQFCELPRQSSVDMSYSVRTAQRAVAHLTGLRVDEGREFLWYHLNTLLRILFWR